MDVRPHSSFRRISRREVILYPFLRRNEQLLLGLLMFVVWSAGYFAVAYFTAGRTPNQLPTMAWENNIPFVPVFIFIYLTIYPLFLLPFLFIHQKEFFRLFSLAYISVMIISYAIFLFFPVSIERPVFAHDSLSTWALGIVYSADKPWNCFPSMHVAMSLMASLTILEVHRVRGILSLLLTIMIAASTVLIKQHYLADVVAGMTLTLIVYFAYFKRRIHDALYEALFRPNGAMDKWVNRNSAGRSVTESLEVISDIPGHEGEEADSRKIIASRENNGAFTGRPAMQAKAPCANEDWE